MHQPVFYAAVVWMSLLISAAAYRAVRVGSGVARILALDLAALLAAALLVLVSDARAVPYFLDAALALALLSFVATLGACRFREGRPPLR